MRDVAERAGVSLKTVSRVINAEAGVTSATAERVTEAIAELGFERNDLAASLRHGRSSHTLGLVIEDVANPFYSAVAQAVEAVARDRGFLLITASAREDAVRERELVAALLRRRVDALLIVPAGPDHRYIAVVVARRLPRPPGARHRGRHRAARRPRRRARRGRAPDRARAHAHRLRRRRRRPLHDARAHRRLPRGAHEGRHRRGPVAGRHRQPRRRRRPGRRDPPPAHATSPPTALFTANNRNTIGALHALRDAPGPVALAGFDDFELADLLGTTVVRADPWKLGEQGAELAFARLDGDDGPPRTVTIPTELVPRGSGER